jgi:hypothetical protein
MPASRQMRHHDSSVLLLILQFIVVIVQLGLEIDEGILHLE